MNPMVMWVPADLRNSLLSFYSDIGRPSIDPELPGLSAITRIRPTTNKAIAELTSATTASRYGGRHERKL
jgi:hypothetical protein